MSGAKAKRALEENPQLLELVREGTPLPLACRAIGLPAAIADKLRDLPQVDQALALREATLRRTFETSPDRDARAAAKVILERDFNWRGVVAKSIEETFAGILQEFSELEPEAYAVLRGIIDRDDASAAERRRRHAQVKG